MILVIDHFDSFSYNLSQLLGGLGLEVRVARCDKVSPDDIRALAPEAVVLSPGPRGPEDTGITLPLLRSEYGKNAAVIGVCLGFQTMAVAWGAKVALAPEVVHGKTIDLTPEPHEVFDGIDLPMRAGRYHSLCVKAESLPQSVSVLAAHQGMAMMALDRARPWVGMQFHPESFLTPQGPELMRNLLRYLRRRNVASRA